MVAQSSKQLCAEASVGQIGEWLSNFENFDEIVIMRMICFIIGIFLRQNQWNIFIKIVLFERGCTRRGYTYLEKLILFGQIIRAEPAEPLRVPPTIPQKERKQTVGDQQESWSSGFNISMVWICKPDNHSPSSRDASNREKCKRKLIEQWIQYVTIEHCGQEESNKFAEL